jgi:hypothetical protein
LANDARAVLERVMTRRGIALLLGVVFAVTWFVAGGATAPAVKDEIHFHESARSFANGFPPTVHQLRNYPEIVTPLALVTWGQLERIFGDALVPGRLLSLMLAFGMTALIALGPRRSLWATVPATLGLLLFPYTLPLSARLYTDVFGIFFAIAGLHAYAGKRAPLAFVGFALAISTRQYLVLVPAAVAAYELLGALRGQRPWALGLSAAAGAATLLAWFAFFGGLAPEPGLAVWIAPYPSPMLKPLSFIIHYGLYALAGLGLYFVLYELALYRRLPVPSELVRPQVLLASALLLALFVFDPPVLTSEHPGGPLGRVARALLPAPAADLPRVAVLFVLAWLTVVRFSARIDLGSWLVAATFVLSMKSQIPWEKYLLPTVASLWYLRAAGVLDLGATRSWRSGELTPSPADPDAGPTPSPVGQEAWLTPPAATPEG